MRYDLTSVHKQGKVLDICWGSGETLSANLNQAENFKLCCITSRGLERRDPLCVYVQGWWDSCELTVQPSPLPPSVICAGAEFPRKASSLPLNVGSG